MPSRRGPLSSPGALDPQGVVQRSEHVPEPYDSVMNRALVSLRAELHAMIDAHVADPERRALMHDGVRRNTKRVWNDLRLMVLEILKP